MQEQTTNSQQPEIDNISHIVNQLHHEYHVLQNRYHMVFQKFRLHYHAIWATIHIHCKKNSPKGIFLSTASSISLLNLPVISEAMNPGATAFTCIEIRKARVTNMDDGIDP